MTVSSSESQDFIHELGQLLVSVGAQAKVTASRAAPSTLHDAHYHLAMVACAMRVHGSGEPPRILAPWLKLLQFVAARPSLVPKLQAYAGARLGHDRDNWSLMPRGYLGDETHDRVVELLVASGVLHRDADFLVAGSRFEVLSSMATRVEQVGLFQRERLILADLGSLRASRPMLGGA